MIMWSWFTETSSKCCPNSQVRIHVQKTFLLISCINVREIPSDLVTVYQLLFFISAVEKKLSWTLKCFMHTIIILLFRFCYTFLVFPLRFFFIFMHNIQIKTDGWKHTDTHLAFSIQSQECFNGS